MIGGLLKIYHLTPVKSRN